MKGDTAQRLFDLVARALDEPPERRRAWIEGACGGDDLLRDRVMRVVEADAALGEFLKTPAPARFDRLVAPGPPLPPDTTVGRYRLLRVIGSGGSGAVYEALQESPHRKVAVKIMAAGLGSTGAVNRFREEAEILARMSHPGVAHVYEAGVHREGGSRLPWLAIEYVEGRDVVAHASALDVRGRLALMALVCDAVHHGHEQGILHGDLKPTNILVDALGRPKVIDFGIARALGDADFDIGGTPPYMSPEQCEPGGRLDVRSDVYALGAVLYEVLAGRRAHDVSDLPLAAALRAVREETPAPVESVDPRLSGDVAAIVGKALARDRGARYASAAALGDDLRRHLARRPVEARPHGPLYVAQRFARREPVVALLAVAIVALCVVAAIVGTRLAWQKEQERGAAERQAYVASLAAASAALRAHDVAEARQQLQRAPEPLRGWEWRHLVGRLDDSVRTIALPGRAIAVGTMSADGARAFAVTMPGPTVHGLDLATGRPLFSEPSARPSALAADAHGARIAVGQYDGAVEFRDGATGALLVRTQGHEGAVNGAAFDPSGLLLASAGRDRTVRLLDGATGAAIGTVGTHEDRAICVSFDGRGERLASGGREGTVRIWDLATRAGVATLKGHEGSVESVAWSPDGRRLVSVSRDRTVRLWDVETGAPLAVRHGHENNVRDVAFAPDGKTFATCSWDRTLRLWGGDDGRALSCLLGHEATIRSVFFLPEGSRIVTIANEIKFWRMETREEVPVLWQRDIVRSLAFVPGGKLLASASHDGAVRLWDVASRREVASVSAPHRRIDQIAIAGDGSAILVLANGMARLWAFDDALRGGAPGRDIAWGGACCAAHGTVAAVGQDEGTVWLLDLATGRPGLHRRVHVSGVSALAFDPRGRTIVAGSAAGSAATLDALTLEPLVRAPLCDTRVLALAFSPDGRTLAGASADGRVRLIEPGTLKVRATLSGHVGAVSSLAFHPDGGRLAAGGEDGTVRIWDPRTGEAVLVLHGPRYKVWTVAWSPDGHCLASGEGTSEGTDCCIRLWEECPVPRTGAD